MCWIAFLIVAIGQAPPEMPDLDAGERTWKLETSDGDVTYVRAKETDFNLGAQSVFAYEDRPEAMSGRQRFNYDYKYDELPGDRAARWEQAIAELQTSRGNVQVESDNGRIWVPAADAEMAERARTAALAVIERQAAAEAAIGDAATAPAAVSTEASTDAPSPLVLWGPQVLVGILAIALILLIGRMTLLGDGVGWQRLD